MKICFLAAASSIHTIRWVNAMVDKGHEVSLITMHPEEENKVDKRVTVYHLKVTNGLGYYSNVFELRKLLKQINPEILNAHYASGYGTLARLSRFQPTLLSVWGSDVYDYPYHSKLNMKNIMKNLMYPQLLASTSYDMKRQINTLVNRDDIEITPFGIDLDLFKYIDGLKKKDTIKIGIVKTLEENYGVKYLIEAFSLLTNKLHEIKFQGQLVELDIVGNGSQKEFLMQYVKTLNLENVVTFTDRIPNNQVPQKLNSFDIYCAPSLAESFGVAIIEASACKLPVVVTNVGGLKEVVKHGETGIIVESENAQQLAEALLKLVLDTNLRVDYGENGRKFVAQHYEWKENVKMMEQAYIKCLNKI